MQQKPQSNINSQEFSIPIILDLEQLTCNQWIDLLDYLKIEYKKIYINCRYNLFFVYNKAMRNKDYFKKMLKSENFLKKNFGLNFDDIIKRNNKKPKITNRSTKININNDVRINDNNYKDIEISNNREGVFKRKNDSFDIDIEKITKIKGEINYVKIHNKKSMEEKERQKKIQMKKEAEKEQEQELEQEKQKEKEKEGKEKERENEREREREKKEKEKNHIIKMNSGFDFSFDENKDESRKNYNYKNIKNNNHNKYENTFLSDNHYYNHNDYIKNNYNYNNDNDQDVNFSFESTIFDNYKFNSCIFGKKDNFINQVLFDKINTINNNSLQNDITNFYKNDEKMSDI
jgi:hypothetical protein